MPGEENMNAYHPRDASRYPGALFAALCFTLFAVPMRSQQDTPTPPLDGIAHVAIRVRDLAASTAFYEKLGFEKAFDLSSEQASPDVEVKIPATQIRATQVPAVKIAVFKINDRQFLELYPATVTDSSVGFLHLCFEGEDLDAISQDYISRGLTPAAIHKSPAGNLLFTVSGPVQPFGPETIEYTQYLPDSLHSNDKGQHLGPDRVADKLIAVALAMDDPDNARDFYINQLNFKPIAGDQMDLHMPGSSGQEVEIVSASLGSQAHLTLNTENLGKAARHLHKQGIPVEKNGASLTIDDPDGNILLLESR